MIGIEETNLSKSGKDLAEQLKKIEQNQQDIMEELEEVNARIDDLEEAVELELEKNLL